MLCSHYVKSVPRGRIFGHLFLAKCSDSVYNPLNTVYSLPYKIYIVCCTVYTVLHYVVQQLSVCFILWKMSPAILYCINHRTVDWANVLRPVKHGSFRDMHVLEQKDEDCLKLRRFAGRDSIANMQIFEAFKFQRMRTGSLTSIFCTFDGVLQILFRLYFHTTMPGLLGAKILVYMSKIFLTKLCSFEEEQQIIWRSKNPSFICIQCEHTCLV